MTDGQNIYHSLRMYSCLSNFSALVLVFKAFGVVIRFE